MDSSFFHRLFFLILSFLWYLFWLSIWWASFPFGLLLVSFFSFFILLLLFLLFFSLIQPICFWYFLLLSYQSLSLCQLFFLFFIFFSFLLSLSLSLSLSLPLPLPLLFSFSSPLNLFLFFLLFWNKSDLSLDKPTYLLFSIVILNLAFINSDSISCLNKVMLFICHHWSSARISTNKDDHIVLFLFEECYDFCYFYFYCKLFFLGCIFYQCNFNYLFLTTPLIPVASSCWFPLIFTLL